MDSKKIRNFNAQNGDQFNSQPGRHHGITLIFTGTNDSGQTGALSDLGSVQINRDDRQIVNASIQDIGLMNDIRFGSVLFSSTTASDFTAAVFIPFFISDEDDDKFQNALNIVEDDELNIEYVPGSNQSTVFTSLDCAVYADMEAYNETYEHRLLRDNETEGSSVASKPYNINKPNVAALYLVDPSDVVTLVELEQNGRAAFSPQSWDKLENDTLRKNKLETSSFDMVELQLFSKGNRGSAVNRDTILRVTTSGGGTIRNLVSFVHFWGSNNRNN